ncbi:MAG: homoserine O-succinyltransferase [Firmicutes bacterium]|nr:homoserine O-succinyltransferase [Bacillota bacterium]
MPVKIPSGLPSGRYLEKENIFVMDDKRATTQEIRPLNLGILNLMPNKIDTEIQLLRLIANTPLQSEVTLLHTASYIGKNVETEHLKTFYKTFDDVYKNNIKFDGLIITGAPVETLEFSEVKYWDELTRIMKWAKTNVHSTIYLCWAAQAGLYYHYGVPKYNTKDKVFGIFEHKVLKPENPIVRGFDDIFLAPHSRHADTKESDLKGKLDVLATSNMAGVYLAASYDLRHIFVTGHSEYDALSLHNEYDRDIKKNLKIKVPYNYYPNNDPSKHPPIKWRSHASLLFGNWINYCVYQATPYNIQEIK